MFGKTLFHGICRNNIESEKNITNYYAKYALQVVKIQLGFHMLYVQRRKLVLSFQLALQVESLMLSFLSFRTG